MKSPICICNSLDLTSRLVVPGGCCYLASEDRSVACSDIGFYHLRWIDDAVEFLLGNEAELQRRSLEREIVVHRVMRHLGRLVVTDHRRERGHEHQGAVDIFLDLLCIRLGSFDEEFAEICTAVRHDRD